MKKSRVWLLRTALALAVLAIPAFAAAAGCGSPPDNSGNWHWVDDVALNMRMVAQGPVAYGTYSTADREVNFSSATRRNAALTWSGYATVSYSASLREWAGSTNSRTTEKISVTVDVPPMKEALLRIRDASRHDFYEFDAGCVWFNAQTYKYQTAVAQYRVSGSANRRWHEASLSIRTLY